jgi:superfamily I DNA and/or RNA helicase
MPALPTHWEDLVRCLELERTEAAARFAADKRDRTSDELVARGVAIPDLEAVDDAVGLGGRALVTFTRAGGQRLEGRWEPGSVVEVSPRRAGDVPSVRAVVSRRSARSLQLAFDDAPPPFVTLGRVWLEATLDERTFLRARANVDTVRGWERGAERRRRAVLLGDEPPRSGPVPPAPPAPRLNPEQAEAVERALAADDFFLVHGPPGTGKSTVLVEVARRARADDRRLLATAASNAAVDHLLELCLAAGLKAVRVGHPARVSPELVEHTLDVLVEAQPSHVLARELFDEAFELRGYARKQRQRGRSRERFANARDAAAEARRLVDQARALEQQAVRAVLDGADVICATLTALSGGELARERFDLALFDEATQAIEPLALAAFIKARTVVMAGDHRQLPPTVLSREAALAGLTTSLFERLLAAHGDAWRLMLREQYRMSEALMAYPSRTMYEGALRAHPSVAGRRLPVASDTPPLLFVDTAGRGFDEEVPPGTDSTRNPGEAGLVIDRARALIAAGLPADELAVIAPYSAQAAELRERAACLPELAGVEIDTVDAFQGREKEAVLVSLTRSNPEGTVGFLADLRRMNVAITRAKSHLFVVGDSATLGGHPYYGGFVDVAQQTGGYVSAWEWPEAT